MKFVTVECSCGRKAQIPAETFGYTPQEFKVDKLADKLPKLKCRDCLSKANFVFNEREQLLFDLSNLSLCSSCETPLSVARLNAVPGTAFSLFAHKKVQTMLEHLLHTHNPPQNLLNALPVKSMDAIPGQKCVRTGQINLGLLVAPHIPNADGRKIYNFFKSQISSRGIWFAKCHTVRLLTLRSSARTMLLLPLPCTYSRISLRPSNAR